MGSLDLQQLRRLDGSCILSVRGKLDESTVRIFADGLDVNLALSRRLVVDLTDCNVSSDGLAALLDLHRRISESTRVVLVAHEPCLLTLLHAVGLTSRFQTYSNVNAALTSQPVQAAPVRTSGVRRRHRLSLLPPVVETQFAAVTTSAIARRLENAVSSVSAAGSPMEDFRS